MEELAHSICRKRRFPVADNAVSRDLGFNVVIFSTVIINRNRLTAVVCETAAFEADNVRRQFWPFGYDTGQYVLRNFLQRTIHPYFVTVYTLAAFQIALASADLK
jgi:hypothetical protein